MHKFQRLRYARIVDNYFVIGKINDVRHVIFFLFILVNGFLQMIKDIFGVTVDIMPYKDKKKQKQYLNEWLKKHPQGEYHKCWWKKNKYKYKNKWIQKLGTNQDKEILNFIQKKRFGQPTPKYKALPIEAFKYNNQAQQSFPNECRKQEDQYNLNYDGEIEGYIWVEGWGYITENPSIFFD